MKCLQCGHCCFYPVVIIDPNSVKDDLNINTLTNKDLIALDGSKKCPHLIWINSKAHCTIHHYRWFKDTPCGKHTQIETTKNTKCRTGEYMQNNPDLLKKLTKQI